MKMSIVSWDCDSSGDDEDSGDSLLEVLMEASKSNSMESILEASSG